MSVDLDHPVAQQEPALPYEPYRALSSAAVASLVVGLLSPLALLDWVLLAIPVVGLVLGVAACRVLARHSEELTGRSLARLGLGLSAFWLVTSGTRLTYVYATEVPDGYRRISYGQLQPEAEQPSQVVPPEALALDGQRVFVKGYPLASSQQVGIQRFVLVRDQGDCCFGGNPKLTDQIEVTLRDPLRFNYELRLLRLAGTFRVHRDRSETGLEGPIYSLEADYLR
jgi:hypothetical protein